MIAYYDEVLRDSQCLARAAVLSVTDLVLAIPYIPPYPQVINTPTAIPSNGVVAVGQYPTFGAPPGLLTEGALDIVTSADAIEVAGTASSFVVALGKGGETQNISLWTPSAPLVVGSYIATGFDESGVAMQSTFTAVTPSSGAVPTPSIAATLSSVQFPANQIPCGETFGISAEVIPLHITTHYTQIPAVNFEFSFAAPDDVQSQHFSRVREPGVLGTQFLPAYFAEGIRNGQLGYVEPQGAYCVQGELLSLQTQQVIATNEACVDDDGRDWAAVLPASSEQIDAQLLACSDPPPEYLPRYCVLFADMGVTRAGCETLTTEELDEARDNPVEVGPLPNDEPVSDVDEPVSDVDEPVSDVDPVDRATPVTPGPVTSHDPPIGPVDPDMTSMADDGNDSESDDVDLDANGNPVTADPDVMSSEAEDANRHGIDTVSADSDGSCTVSTLNTSRPWLACLGFGLLLLGLVRTRRHADRF